MANFLFMVIAAAIFALLAVLFIAIWVFRDARQRGLQAGMWTLLVVISGSFIGLILYLLVGRKQKCGVCDQCGATFVHQGAFCPMCGEQIAEQKRVIRKNKGFLVACIVCIALVFVSLGIGLYSYFNADGFPALYSYSSYNNNLSGSARNVSQRSSGHTWEISYDEASGGYTFTNTYNAASRPLSLSVDIKCSGSMQLIVMQDGVSINETIVQGIHHFDMDDFGPGRITIKLLDINAANLSGTIVMDTGD